MLLTTLRYVLTLQHYTLMPNETCAETYFHAHDAPGCKTLTLNDATLMTRAEALHVAAQLNQEEFRPAGSQWALSAVAVMIPRCEPTD